MLLVYTNIRISYILMMIASGLMQGYQLPLYVNPLAFDRIPHTSASCADRDACARMTLRSRRKLQPRRHYRRITIRLMQSTGDLICLFVLRRAWLGELVWAPWHAYTPSD